MAQKVLVAVCRSHDQILRVPVVITITSYKPVYPSAYPPNVVVERTPLTLETARIVSYVFARVPDIFVPISRPDLSLYGFLRLCARLPLGPFLPMRDRAFAGGGSCPFCFIVCLALCKFDDGRSRQIGGKCSHPAVRIERVGTMVVTDRCVMCLLRERGG